MGNVDAEIPHGIRDYFQRTIDDQLIFPFEAGRQWRQEQGIKAAVSVSGRTEQPEPVASDECARQVGDDHGAVIRNICQTDDVIVCACAFVDFEKVAAPGSEEKRALNCKLAYGGTWRQSAIDLNSSEKRSVALQHGVTADPKKTSH